MAAFHILAVCTGNICRSPAIERLLALDLAASDGAPSGRFTVSSAGTSAVVGSPISDEMARLLDQAGARVDGFAARNLTADIVEGASLILTATAAHRAAVTKLSPAALGRAFTLLEFSRSLELIARSEAPRLGPDGPADSDDSPGPATDQVVLLDGPRRLMELARRSRPLLRLAPGETDVPDPWGRDAAAYLRAFTTIRRATAIIASALTQDCPGEGTGGVTV